jgi:hypothetical protein
MIPQSGTTCKFVFAPRFSVLNGVYRVRSTTTFVDAMSSGIDFVANLYTPAGMTANDFNQDYPSYQYDQVVSLESVLDATVILYVPETVFPTVPDPTVKEYFSLLGVVNLGVQSNPQLILPLMDQITDAIQSTLGTTETLRIATNPQNKVYLTDTEYAALDVARQSHIKELMPFSVQLKNAQDIITYQAAKIAAYEALIVQLSQPPAP